ncbi:MULTISPECIES: RNA chaperone Hfq [Aneurinibacillus]|uniref:RNA-binding protein Hfq n=1 Tax=Aneurinibacillus danicus TaxID=267746 RepID=A0A511V3N7_9BACL|nr:MULTISPECIES: RNA chaperone Hfq [Aneurinibacillus]GEN33537.1 RNA-binding protein Hfq [Aneurinibacillus danicus]
MEKAKLQDYFLNQLRSNKIPVTVFTINGVQMRGLIASFDQYTVAIQVENKQNILYKAAISTIVPLKPVSLTTK